MKKFLLIALIMFMTCSTGFAENIYAVGRGNSERMAIRDAMRTAIEKKFGAVINSRTKTKNFALISDENAVDSAGFVSSWEIISSRVENGIFVVEIRAELDDKKISAVNKKAVVDFHADNPRIAVIATDLSGKRYLEIENEIISALKRQGFTRIVDLAQKNRAVQQRIISADDEELCKTLATDFHADFLVLTNVSENFSVSSRLIALNTGEIVYAGNFSGEKDFFSRSDALKLAGRRAGNEISIAALKSAANLEKHLTLLITKDTFNLLGGTLTAVSQQIKNFSGVNDVFARKMSTSLEFDIDFDGTAADFARLLESFSIKILEVSAGYVKI